MADERAGWSTEDRPAARNATANRAGERRGALQRQDDQREAARGETRLGHHQQPPPVDRVGERAGAEREQEDRDELEERQRRDREGRPGQDVDLVRQRDPGDLVADAVDDLAGPQPAVVAIEAERRRVEEEAADASIHPARPRATRVRRRPARRDWSGPSVCPCVAKLVSPGRSPVTTVERQRRPSARRSWTSRRPPRRSTPIEARRRPRRIAARPGIARRPIQSSAGPRTCRRRSVVGGLERATAPRRRWRRSGAAARWASGVLGRPSPASTA